ncbi:MAG: LytTR family DNA-binding domain-containing protein [Bacteroidota bacterium]
MKCIVIEDQPPAQRILKKFISDIQILDLKGVFSDATEAMVYLGSNEVDLIFLDIHLPKISGIDFLKTLTNSPNVILTTAFSDYALESYEFKVVDYLLKPFSFQRFVKAVTKAQSMSGVTEPKADKEVKKEIFVKSGHEHIKLSVDKILFIKSDASYTEIHLPEHKYLSVEPLRYWLENLDANQFVQIHKSYIVNVSCIIKVSAGQILFSDDVSVPIGRAYKEEFMKRFVK